MTVQVRDLDADVQERLRTAAARDGLSLSAFLRKKLTELADDLDVMERARQLNSAQMALGGPFKGFEQIKSEELVAMIREDRDSR